MSLMEIRIHGRGGQGNVVAANLLAMSAFEVGRYGQAFPSFGAERRGAPVVAFVRIADQPIQRRSQVQRPAFLIIQDEALLKVPGVTEGLLEGGGMLVNSPKQADALGLDPKVMVVAIPATQLAKEFLGRPVPNTALLAGFLTLTGLFPTEALIQVLGQKFKGEVLESNARLIREAAGRVPAGQWKDISHATST